VSRTSGKGTGNGPTRRAEESKYKSVDAISKKETSKDVGKKVAFVKRRPRLPVLGRSAKKSNGG
jgi:hypothetical protein